MSVIASVIIPTWQRISALELTMNALTSPDVAGDAEVEIIVVSDGEDAGLRALSSRYGSSIPIHWLFHDTNRGLPAARNSGARVATGDLLVFLDDDVVPQAGWLDAHVSRHEIEGPRTIVVGSLSEEYSTARSFRVWAVSG